MKVLIVDDREDNRLILETKVRAAGYGAATAENGTEALARLRRERFDLVVTDLMMPGMDGFQLTHDIRADPELRNLPVLVYTATYTDPEDEALVRSLGASGFLVKPAGDEEFFAAVRAALAEARERPAEGRAPSPDELHYLRQYNERLVRKLEDKVEDYEAAQRSLRELNASLERRVEEATRELRRANEDLEAFSYSVSHDLRAPLRGIQGFVGAVLADDPPLSEAERRGFLRRAEAMAARGQALIEDLLRYARLKSTELPLEPVALADVFAMAFEQVDPALCAAGNVTAGRLAAVVRGHQATLVQVVQNLLTNALKFRRPGERARVEVNEEAREGRVRLLVRDHGIGIAPQFHARIFQVFERLHSAKAYAGTGVGLAIVARAMEKMGGRVGMESEEGAGSTFWIELPEA